MSSLFRAVWSDNQTNAVYPIDGVALTSTRRPVVVAAFGDRLAAYRGRRSRQQIVLQLKGKFGIKLDPSTLHQYERGSVNAPDPVVLWGLAQIYGVDVRVFIDLLVSSRGAAAYGAVEGADDELARVGTDYLTDDERELVERFRTMNERSRDGLKTLVRDLTPEHVKKRKRGAA